MLFTLEAMGPFMNLRRLVGHFFGFSRMETNGFLVLVPLLLLILLSEPMYRHWRASQSPDFSAEAMLLDSMLHLAERKSSHGPFQEKEKTYYNFNPNTVHADELIHLGFDERVANRIVNYRNKGGRFYKKTDLYKIYGIDSGLVRALLPFVQLPAKSQSAGFAATQPEFQKNEKPAVTSFNLNTADTTQLKRIYGIGPTLSLRIVKYRESLGGFVNNNQLAEVYGLDSTVINRLIEKSFIAENFEPIKININTATEEELNRHAYITRKQAKAIVAYRYQHGKFTSIADLQKIIVVDAQTIDKARPYLTVE